MEATQHPNGSLAARPSLSIVPNSAGADPIETLVRSHGNLALAAERSGLAQSELLEIAAQDLPRLQRALRAAQILDLFDLADSLKTQFKLSLSRLEPADLAKTYMSVHNLLVTLSDDKTTQQNISVTYEQEFQRLNPNMRDALSVLKNDSTIIDALSEDFESGADV